MQHRTKAHLLSQEQILRLLDRASVGRIATISEDGYPYIVPMHFIHYGNKIYMHGLPKGKKVDNINHNPNVCFEVDEMLSLLDDGVKDPCDVNSEFNSVIIEGQAQIISDFEEKSSALFEIIKKYTPHLADLKMPEKMIRGTAVIGIDILKCVGRYYK